MVEKNWQTQISDLTIEAYRTMYKVLTELFPKYSGLILSRKPMRYLNVTQKERVSFPLSLADKRAVSVEREKLLARRKRNDSFFKLLLKWAVAERIGPTFEKYYVVGEEPFQLPTDDIRKFREKVAYAIKEFTAVLVYKYTVFELVSLASMGDDKSLLQLVELDKVFLTARFVQKRIHQAQGLEDRKFFQKLSSALLVDLFREHHDTVNLGLASYLLWHLGFVNLPKKELYSFLKAEKLMPYSDPMSFNRMLCRIGLTRYQKVGHRRG